MAKDLIHLLKSLSDPTRLRILTLLCDAELSVSELARAMAMSQPRISNHIKLLRDAGMLVERREGSFLYLLPSLGDGLPEDLWNALRQRVEELRERAADESRLRRVLQSRRNKSREFFDRVAKDWDQIGQGFARGVALHQALHALTPPGLVVADVGCGTGSMARALVRVAHKVICIDHSRAMLEEARKRLEPFLDRVEFRPGEVDRLPLEDQEVDAVFASMVMHHVPDLKLVLREFRRALKSGGTLVIIDLLPHEEEWLTEHLADLRMGLDPNALRDLAVKAGFDPVEIDRVDDSYVVEADGNRRAELPVFVLSGRAPAAAPPADRGSSSITTRALEEHKR